MKELVVISGKGGTGKTSLVSSFAHLAENAVLCDCDVDAADLHIILQPDIQKTHAFSGGKQAKIRYDKCQSCGTCKKLCKFNAVKKTNETYTIDPVFCEGCGVCYWFCPAEAIEFQEVQNGEWYESNAKNGSLIHAKLFAAQENSGKLVSVIREAARKTAGEKEKNLIIIDGSPGIGCPVIASITGADYVLIVTEPTLSGKHDMERVIALCRHFQIPCSVTINKWDINPEISNSIEDFCRKNNISIPGKIRYDLNITYSQIELKSIVEFTSQGAAEDIKNIWEIILNQLTMSDKNEFSNSLNCG